MTGDSSRPYRTPTNRRLNSNESEEIVKCECPDPDHYCTNEAADHGVDVSPALCVPCLYGCMP